MNNKFVHPIFRNSGLTIRELLMCRCEQIICPVDSDVVELRVPAYNCTDMTGAITVATMCNPTVQQIKVVAGGKLDIVYERQRGQDWRAYETRRNAREPR